MAAEPQALPRVDVSKVIRKLAVLGMAYAITGDLLFNHVERTVRSKQRRQIVQKFINSNVVAATTSLREGDIVRLSVPREYVRAGSLHVSPNALSVDAFLRLVPGTGFMKRIRMRRYTGAPLGGFVQDYYEIDIRVDVDHPFWDSINKEINARRSLHEIFQAAPLKPDAGA